MRGYYHYLKTIMKEYGTRRFFSITLNEFKNRRFTYYHSDSPFPSFKSKLSEDEIVKIVKKTDTWYHSFLFENIPNQNTRVMQKHQQWVSQIIPENLENKTVLDLGCGDGFYGFLCAQRGAKKVVCADFIKFPGFESAQKIIDSNIEHRIINLPDLDIVEKFDIVLFFGLYYHLSNPIEMLKKLYHITNESLLLSGPIILDDEPLMYYYDPYELNSTDSSNWWIASPSCLIKSAKRLGFKNANLKKVNFMQNFSSMLKDKKTKRFVYKEGIFEFTKEPSSNNELEIDSKITELYNKFLQRDPDSIGLNYFRYQIINGKSFTWLENELKNSKEYKMSSSSHLSK